MSRKTTIKRKKNQPTSASILHMRHNKPSKKQISKLLQHGIQQHQSGALDGAEESYRAILKMDPNHADALYFLGNIYLYHDDLDNAQQYLEKAIAANPQLADYHVDYGNVMREKGEMTLALKHYRYAVKLKQDYPEVHFNIGLVCSELNDVEGSIQSYQTAIRYNPELSEAHYRLGVIFLNNANPTAAEDHLRKTVVLNETKEGAYTLLGHALIQQDNLEMALRAYSEAIRINSNDADAHMHLGMGYLQINHFDEGWDEWEWRHQQDLPPDSRFFFKPRWNGDQLTGKRLLITCEQTWESSIQFSRFLPLLAEFSGSIVLECHNEAMRLFAAFANIDEYAPKPEEGLPSVFYDTYIPLTSVPGIVKCEAPAISAGIPYLQAESGLVESWKSRLQGRIRIGISLLGAPVSNNQTILIDIISGFLDHPDVTFYLLRSRKETDTVAVVPNHVNLISFNAIENDLADMAAIIENLDLVITEDTAIAHLAGAMGKLAWVILPFSAAWYYGQRSENSVWYPNLCLFRQTAFNNWENTVAKVREELQRFVLSNLGS